MAKDKDEKILKSSLSTLLKRFSNTDVISTLEKEYSQSSPGYKKLDEIEDNHILKKARINEARLENAMFQISQKGLASPLLLVKVNENYEVLYPRIAYIAMKKLKMATAPCTVIDIGECDMLIFLATRINQDKDSNIVEMSLVLNRLAKKFNFTQKEIAEMMRQSRSQITNIMRLIKMPAFVLKDISNNKLSFGHARALSTLAENDLVALLPRIYEEKLSVREVERMVYGLKKSPFLLEEEKVLSQKLDCRVSVSPKTVSLRFKNEKDRENFVKKMKRF